MNGNRKPEIDISIVPGGVIPGRPGKEIEEITRSNLEPSTSCTLDVSEDLSTEELRDFEPDIPRRLDLNLDRELMKTIPQN